jgi:hypothetical protein
VRERPLTLDDRMVAAVRDGRKTQVRIPVPWQGVERVELLGGAGVRCHQGNDFRGGASFDRQCPLGAPGERLWVREAWCIVDPSWPHAEGRDARPWAPYRELSVVYRVDGPAPGHVPWFPAPQMGRDSSRLLLEVLDVRVERLNAVTPTDVGQELGQELRGQLTELEESRLTDSFVRYWDSVHGKGRCSWEKNPWTWVVRVALVREVFVRAARPMSSAELGEAAAKLHLALEAIPPFVGPEQETGT